MSLVERDAVEEVIQRGVVHRRRIACLVNPGARGGVPTTAREPRPYVRLVESRGVDRGVDRGVLHRVDLAQQQRNLGVVGHCRDRGAHSGISGARSGAGGSRGAGCAGDHHHSVKTHGALDRGMRAGLDQVRAGLQRRPSDAADSPAQGGRGARARGHCRHLGGERLHAWPLRWGRTNARQRLTWRIPGDGPSERLGVGVVRTRHGVRRRPETAAQLTHDHERGRHGIRSAAHRRKRKIVREVDGQVLPRRHCNHDRGPAGRCRRRRRWRIRIQLGAGRRRASDLGRIAGVAPHRHHRAIRQRQAGWPRGQVDLLLGGGRAAGQQENGSRQSRSGQARLGVVGAHCGVPRSSSIRQSRTHANRRASSSACRRGICCWW